jgi:hypothetical protein
VEDMTIERGKVELSAGAIAPVSRGLWHAAYKKLAEAAASITQMQQAKNRVEFEAGWTRLVDSLGVFWTRFFDEGKNKFSSFQPWAGEIDAQRKQDPLLTYLYQARHQSQHGLIALEWAEGKVQIGGGEFFGTVKNLRISPSGAFEADITSSAGSDAKFKVVYDPGDASLPTVINKRHNQTFPPPTLHQGKSIAGITPVDAGQLGIRFYDDILRKSLEKFGKTL